MKRLLILPLLLLLALAGCEKKEATPARLVLNIYKQEQAGNGQVTAPATPAIIHVWKAENREFDVTASGSDVYLGFAYDKISKTSYTADYGAVGETMNEEIEPGKYFVYVLLNKSANAGSLAHSYTYFEIKEGQRLSLKKTFSYDVGTEQYEAWNKNK